MTDGRSWNIAFEISPMLAASGSFGDKSGVYRYTYNLIIALSDYLLSMNSKQYIVLFSFLPDLFQKLSNELAELENRKNIVILRKLPIRPGPLFAYDNVKPRLLYRACRKMNHIYMKLNGMFNNLRYARQLHRDLLEHNVGIIHQSETIQREIPGITSVITIHDLVAVKFPHWQREETVRIHRNKLEFARRHCAGIITVSKHTARDLQEYYRDTRYTGIVKTIYEAATLLPQPDGMSWSDIEGLMKKKGYKPLSRLSYFLHVGTFEPRKNIELLVDAFITNYRTEPKFSNLRLVLVGGSGWGNVYSRIRKRIKTTFSHNTCPILILNYVNDAELSLLLKGALALVYPTQYEGFGLPILEAMQYGTPVIAADATSIPEVCGNACRMVPSNSVAELARAMCELSASTSVRAKLSSKSVRRAREFSWQAAAIETHALYRKVVREVPRLRPRGSAKDRKDAALHYGEAAYRFLIQRLRKSKHLELFYVGAAGHENVGDDLILATLKRDLAPRRISVLTDGINDDDNLRKRLHSSGFHITKNRCKLYQRKTLILFGGGTLFNTAAFPEETYLRYAYQLLLEGYQLGFLGIEIVDILDILRARYVFRNAAFIGVRNQETKKTIESLCMGETAPIFITGDVLEYMPIPEPKMRRNMSETNSKTIGICISPKTGVNAKQLKELVGLLSLAGYTCEYFSFCTRPDNPIENDLLIAEQISNALIHRIQDPEKLVEHLAEYDGIITSRFHAALLAHRMGIPVIVTSKEIKNVRYCAKTKIPRFDSLEMLLAQGIDDIVEIINMNR